MANIVRMNDYQGRASNSNYDLSDFTLVYPYTLNTNELGNIPNQTDIYKARMVEMQWALGEITYGTKNLIDMTKVFSVSDYWNKNYKSSSKAIEESFINSKKSCIKIFQNLLTIAKQNNEQNNIQLIKNIMKLLSSLEINDTTAAATIVEMCNILFNSKLQQTAQSDILIQFYYYLDTPEAYASLSYGTEIFSRGKILEEFFKDKKKMPSNLTDVQLNEFTKLSRKYNKGEINDLKNLVTKYLSEQLTKNLDFTVTGITIQGLLDFSSNMRRGKYSDESAAKVKDVRDRIVDNFKQIFTTKDDGKIIYRNNQEEFNSNQYKITPKGNIKINGLLLSQDILVGKLTNKAGIATKMKGNVVDTSNTPTNLDELVNKILLYANTSKYQKLLNNKQELIRKLKTFINSTDEKRIITQFSNSGISGVLGELKSAIALSKFFNVKAQIVGTSKTSSGSQAGDIKFSFGDNTYYAQIKNSIELHNTISLYGTDITLQSANALKKYFPVEYVEPLRFFVANYFEQPGVNFPSTISNIAQEVTNGLLQRINSSLLQFYRIEAFDWIGKQNSFFILYNYLVPTPCLMVLINEFLNDDIKIKAKINNGSIKFNTLAQLRNYSKRHDWITQNLGDNYVGPNNILQKNKIHQSPIKINLAAFSLR